MRLNNLFALLTSLSLLLGGCDRKGATTKEVPKASLAAQPKEPAKKQAGAAPVAKKAPTTKGDKTKVPAAAKGLDGAGAMQISASDRCPVCGMMVAKHKKFASAIALSDGTAYHFCGTGCMIKSWLHPEIFIGQPKSSLAKAVTPEYFGGKYIDAATARWVAGSDVVGPMGPALVPLKDDADLATFKKRHGAKVVFKLGEVDDAKWKAITGKNATMRPPGKK